jgi:predicted nucleic acid-binding protein
MKVLLDSSVLIAALLPDHVHHAAAHAWLKQAKIGTFEYVVSGHSTAEVYSVLTRLPRTPPILPPDAWRLLQENVISCAKIVTLSDSNYVDLLKDLSQRGISGGAVYDAIIAKAAELAAVDHLLTINESRFHRVWPVGSSKIVSPLLVAAPTLK